MRFPRLTISLFGVVLAVAVPSPRLHAEPADSAAAEKKSLNVLFIGNSYTGRHNLAQIVKSMAEAADETLTFNPTTVIYGGRTLADHWRLGTQSFVRLHSLTPDEERSTIAALEKLAENPGDRYAGAALKRHRALLAGLEAQRTTWDVVVLQSYRDDLEAEDSLYSQYAPKFAKLARAQGARVVLYETTPTTQNAEPLSSAPDSAGVMKKARLIARLADRIGARAAPMALVGHVCQTERPDLTLRFVNDAHLNQTMAYLTACTIYAAMFDRSPVGLPVNSVTDIRYLDNNDKTKDRDGKPITLVLSDEDRADLQRIAWEGFTRFQNLRSPTP